MTVRAVLPPPVSRPWVLVAAVVWLLVALFGQKTASEIPAGSFEGVVTLTGEPREGRHGAWALGAIEGGVVLVESEEINASRGDELVVVGLLDGVGGSSAGRNYGSSLRVNRVVDVVRSDFWLHRAGNAIRTHVMADLAPFDAGRGLLAGFLIGDTTHVADGDSAAMRKSGLSHFVAVSGSNVVLFLTLLAVLAGPLALGPRRRAVICLAGLPLYTAATGFEPSVMRASAMASFVLVGRLIGIVLESWQLLSLAVGVLVLIDPALTSSVGFQLSVAATGGVLMGSRWPVPGKVTHAFAITIGAQIAVAPLILVHFGSVPLLSPLVNLISAPLVTFATAVGAVGVTLFDILIYPASWVAGMVLVVARGSAGFPQLGVTGLLVSVVAALVTMAIRPLRRYLAIPLGLALALVVLPPDRGIDPGEVVVLDVGQGDSILLSGGHGRFALVDGGPDGPLLLERLRALGVTSLDFVILSHVHADHVSGLIDVIGSMEVGQVWVGDGIHQTAGSKRFSEELTVRSIPSASPTPGSTFDLGALSVRVEGPVRRYKSPNDESLVVTVTGSDRSMLLAGDIEVVAQADLTQLRADVLKVPHQGAATSSPDWLEGVGAEEAVISVGPNQFGHPAQWVVSLFDDAGVLLHRTDEEGDVVIDLGSPRSP